MGKVENLASFFFELEIFDEEKFYFTLFDGKSIDKRLVGHENCYKILHFAKGNIDAELKRYRDEIDNPTYFGRYFRLDPSTYSENFLSYCENIPTDDPYFIEGVFQSIDDTEHLSIFADVFGTERRFGERIRKFDMKEINFLFENYYMSKDIPDSEYFFLLTHPHAETFFEKIIASIPERVGEYAYEKLLNIYLTYYNNFEPLHLSKEILSLILEKRPEQIKIEKIFFSKCPKPLEPCTCMFLKKVFLERAKDFKSYISNYEEISACNEFECEDYMLRMIVNSACGEEIDRILFESF